jgi:dTMP kinase
VLVDHGYQTLITREPGGTALGEALREVLLNGGEMAIGADAELMLMFAARAQHHEEVIQPALKKGEWVISDRFTDASYAYQGARGMSQQRIKQLEAWCLGSFQPHLTLLLDLPLELGLARVDQRGEKDRFEREDSQYKQQVREIYLQRAAHEPGRIKVINASGGVRQVSDQVTAHLTAFLNA